ncbi:sororin [Scyliorhinus canicula]|uniref:sororin n=1 Tax=Scyliorhinus canicula TaxID=7830 RepID=UPI0018F756F1|nr:sororin [Scyliorhinus canicula]
MAAATGAQREPDLHPPARRKSDRLAEAESKENVAPVVKRSIVLKKIEPQKNAQKRVSGEPRQSPQLTKPTTAAPRRSPRLSPEARKENVCLSLGSPPGDEAGKVLASPRGPSAVSPPRAGEAGVSPDTDPSPLRSTAMSQKVRRSYSRLSPLGIHALNTSAGGRGFRTSPCPASEASDTSTPNQLPASRRSFFGFERLLAGEAALGVSPVKPLIPKEAAELLGQVSHAAELAPSPDRDIPGIAIVKQKRKKRKIPQIEKSALDEWAAQMNASFDEAERFDLLVE